MTDSPTIEASEIDESGPALTGRREAGTDASVNESDVAAVLGGPVRRHDRGVAEPKAPAKIAGVVIGTIVDYRDSGIIRIDFPLNPEFEPVSARSTVAVTAADIGRDVALLFEDADPSRPIIMGFMQQLPVSPVVLETEDGAQSVQVEVTDHGKRMTLSADDQITIRCGESSITLTRAGKILLKGKYLSSHAAGVNRIRGGSVQLN